VADDGFKIVVLISFLFGSLFGWWDNPTNQLVLPANAVTGFGLRVALDSNLRTASAPGNHKFTFTHYKVPKMPKMPKWLAPALIAFRHVASAMHYLHVTDFHIDPLYRHNGHVVAMCHAENDGNSLDNVHANVDRAGYFGTRGSICDSPQSLVDGTFDAIARLNMTIPLVFWTGDSSRHDRDRSNPKTLNDVFQQNDLVVKQFQSTFNLSETVIVPSIGNWDVFPADYLPPKGDSPTMLDRLYESWRPLINSTEIEKSFKQGGWFKKTVEDLTIISLNTMWWFAANSAVGDCKGDGMGDEQLEWVQETLKDLKGKAILIGHVPPVFDGGILYSPQCYIKFVRLLAQDGQGDKKIIGSFFGHTNKDSMAFVIRHPVVKPDRNAQLPLKKGPSHSIDLMYLSSQHTPTYDVGDSQILSVLFTAPSVVPVNNPSFRVGKLDRVDGEWAHQYWNQVCA